VLAELMIRGESDTDSPLREVKGLWRKNLREKGLRGKTLRQVKGLRGKTCGR
jgi:hypothetical protein